MEERASFEQWAIVEVMGHNTYAGLVTEQTIAGHGFIRVDVPELPVGAYKVSGGVPAFTKIIGAGSIYSITPCSEEIARKAAESVRVRPVSMLSIPVTRQIESPDYDDDIPV